MQEKKLRIAIIGAGVSGLTIGYMLNKKHDITIYEKNNYVGGHVNTIDVIDEKRNLSIDTGFIVFNDKTYPNFIDLLNKIGQESQKSVMSFSVSNKLKNLEYNGSSLNGLFSQRRNILKPSFLKMISDILRFNKNRGFSENNDRLTVSEFLESHHYSKEFTDDYLIPMASSIWSAKQNEIMNMPITFLLKFFDNHGLLQIKDRPQWMVIRGGSREYVRKLTADFKDKIRLSSKITSIQRHNENITVNGENTKSEDFDYVFLATHSDQALEILDSPSVDERHVLSQIRYQENVAILHTDSKVMPTSRRAWAAWNYYINKNDSNRVKLTYCMNILQSIESKNDYLVTLNDEGSIDKRKIIDIFKYHHPVFDAQSVAAQQQYDSINGYNRTFYLGAYWRNGFHEDGVISAMNAYSNFRERVTND